MGHLPPVHAGASRLQATGATAGSRGAAAGLLGSLSEATTLAEAHLEEAAGDGGDEEGQGGRPGGVVVGQGDHDPLRHLTAPSAGG